MLNSKLFARIFNIALTPILATAAVSLTTSCTIQSSLTGNSGISNTPIISFSASTESIDEDDALGSRAITVNLSIASDDPVTVDLSVVTGVTGGTAVGGVNYTLSNQTLTFAPGTTSQTFNVAIIDDAVYTGDQTVIYELSTPSDGAELGATASQTLTISEATVLHTPYYGLSYGCVLKNDGTVKCFEGAYGAGAVSITDIAGATSISMNSQVSHDTHVTKAGVGDVNWFNSGATASTSYGANNIAEFKIYNSGCWIWGYENYCQRHTNGTAYCYNNNVGIVNDGIILDGGSNLTSIASVSVTGDHQYFLMNNGNVKYAYLSGASLASADTGVANATKITSGNDRTCAIINDGTVSCFTAGGSDSATVAGVTGARDIATTSGTDAGFACNAGDGVTCAALGDGTVKCWDGFYGGTATTIAGLDSVWKLGAGQNRICATRKDNSVKCWTPGGAITTIGGI